VQRNHGHRRDEKEGREDEPPLAAQRPWEVEPDCDADEPGWSAKSSDDREQGTTVKRTRSDPR